MIQARRKRGKAKNDRQLGAVQVKLLEWLLVQEEKIRQQGDKHMLRTLYAKGIAWSAKTFCKAHPDYGRPDGTINRSTLSTSLKALEKSGLVQRIDAACGLGTRCRTSHVKLTDAGRVTALARRADPRTWQEKRAAKKDENMEMFKIWERERRGEDRHYELVSERAREEWLESAEYKAIAEHDAVEAALIAENIELLYTIDLDSVEMGPPIDSDTADKLALAEFRRYSKETYR